MSLFVSNKLFPIDVKYVEVKLKNNLDGIIVIKDEEQEKKYEGKVKELHTQWLQPNWKDSNELIRQATIWDAMSGERTLDFHLYRSFIPEKFLKAWDITDDEGKPVPCMQASIVKLEPNIANYLIDQFISKNVPTEADLKN